MPARNSRHDYFMDNFKILKILKLKGDFVHIVYGIILVLSFYLHHIFPIVLSYLMIKYQLSEQKKINDSAYKDILDIMVSVVVTIVILSIIKIMKG